MQLKYEDSQIVAIDPQAWSGDSEKWQRAKRHFRRGITGAGFRTIVDPETGEKCSESVFRLAVRSGYIKIIPDPRPEAEKAADREKFGALRYRQA